MLFGIHTYDFWQMHTHAHLRIIHIINYVQNAKKSLPVILAIPPHVCSVTSDSVTPWTVAQQASLSVGFPRQEYWSGLPFPTPGDLLAQGRTLIFCVSCFGRCILYHCPTWEAPKRKKNEKRQAISDSLIIMLLWNIKTFLMLPKCLEWGARDSSILDHMKFFTPRMDLQVLFVEQ